MFPVGDPGTGGIQGHVEWCGPEHAGNLHVGRTPIGVKLIARVRLGPGRRTIRTIAQARLAHGGVLALGRPCTRAAEPGTGRREAVASGLPVWMPVSAASVSRGF